MRIVILGLSLSSSWGNGHATTYRSLVRALAETGAQILFLERDAPWYAAHRDQPTSADCDLVFYSSVDELAEHRRAIREADLVIVGSYVEDGPAVIEAVDRMRSGVFAFYDIDTPVTLSALADDACAYLRARDVARFDLYLSFSGGAALGVLTERFGARAAHALYCGVDARAHAPLECEKRWDLSYLGTYAADRQPALQALLIDAARARPSLRFCVAGPLYPPEIVWPANVERIEHVPPAAHARFYAESRLTLNVTRADMKRLGHSPSVRLFEAGACGAAILSDAWEGLSELLVAPREILVGSNSDDTLAALALTDRERATIGAAARAKILAAHTADARARTLLQLVEAARGAQRAPAEAGA